MPIPTITSVTPALGHTGGKALVEIIGTNFRAPTTQAAPADGPVPVAPPSVEVLFGSTLAPRVMWISATRMFVQTPEHDEQDVALTVRNVDDDGILIPTETVTLASAFAFRRPQLGTSGALTAIIRTLLQRLKRQVHPNVVLSVHTDYDESTTDLLNITKVAELPALVLQGPRLPENRFYSKNALPHVDSSTPEEFFITREPYTVDIEFDFLGISNLQIETQNFMEAVILFFKKNKTIAHPTTNDELELDFMPDGTPRSVVRFGNDNVRLFRGAFVIRGFDVGSFAGFVQDMVVEAARRALDQESPVELQSTTNMGETFPVGASPGLPESSPAVTPAARTGLVFPRFGQSG